MAKKETDLEEYYNVQAVKSNVLISSKYRSNLLEQRILTYVFANIDSVQRREDAYYFEFHTSVLMNMIKASSSSGSYYSRLKEAAKALTGRTIGFEDPVNHSFGFYNIVNSATYADGKMTLKFNKDIGDTVLFNLKSNYTRLPLLVMMEFKSVYSMRLYEVLRSIYYKKHTVTYGISELKLTLGVVNTNIEAVRRVLDSKKNLTESDFELAVAKCPERMFDTWRSFRSNVIEVAVKEINKVSDMRVEYSTIRTGHGGKVTGITFKMYLVKEDTSQKTSLSDDDKLLFYDNIRDKMYSFGVRISTPEARQIAQEAEFDEARVNRAIHLVMESVEPGTVQNPVGYIIKAIRGNYWASDKQMERYRNRYLKPKSEVVDTKKGDMLVAEDASGQLEFVELEEWKLPENDKNS